MLSGWVLSRQKKRPFVCFVVEGKQLPEESVPDAHAWHWCWDGQPHLSQWPDQGTPQSNLFIQPAYGRVDLLDQMVDHVVRERAFHKFWKKCFFFSIINRIVFCSYILYWDKFISPAQADTIPVHVHPNWGIICILWGSGNSWLCFLTTQSCPSPWQERESLHSLCSKKEAPPIVRAAMLGYTWNISRSWIIQQRRRKSDKLWQNSFLLGFFSIAIAVVYSKVPLQALEPETWLPIKNSTTNSYCRKIVSFKSATPISYKYKRFLKIVTCEDSK